MKVFKNSYFCAIDNKLSPLYLILIIAPLFSACNRPKEKERETSGLATSAPLSPTTSEKYSIDTKESIVTYRGSNIVATKGSHTGYVYFSNGELIFDKDQFVGGSVEVDMNTIADKDHGSKNELVRHLKSSDFFDVEKFPISTFVITIVAPATAGTISVTGNMTIKGITHAVTFPAKIDVKDGTVHASGQMTIDRTRWDVRYNSGKFFSNLADEVISDDIEFDIKIVARK